jgi:hypothetical protein
MESISDAVNAIMDAKTTVDTQPETTIDTQPETIVDPIVDPKVTVDPKVMVNPIVTDMGEELEEEEEKKKKEEAAARIGFTPVEIGSGGIADIDYFYDFGSIFATPEQEKAFTRPFKQYTNVEDPLSNYEADMLSFIDTPYNLFETEDETAKRLFDLIRS